jgi:hypothetical protein
VVQGHGRKHHGADPERLSSRFACSALVLEQIAPEGDLAFFANPSRKNAIDRDALLALVVVHVRAPPLKHSKFIGVRDDKDAKGVMQEIEG